MFNKLFANLACKQRQLAYVKRADA